MPPFRDAVGFVDGDQIDFHPMDLMQKAFLGHSFRRHIEEIQGSFSQAANDLRPFRLRLAAVEEGGPQTDFTGGIHLVLHQRDQGADDQGGPRQHPGGQLIAEGFPSSGGHDGKDVAAALNGPDDVLLVGPKFLKAEDPVKGFSQSDRMNVETGMRSGNS